MPPRIRDDNIKCKIKLKKFKKSVYYTEIRVSSPYPALVSTIALALSPVQVSGEKHLGSIYPRWISNNPSSFKRFLYRAPVVRPTIQLNCPVQGYHPDLYCSLPYAVRVLLRRTMHGRNRLARPVTVKQKRERLEPRIRLFLRLK